ncbi:MAG: RNA-directed DNA polymerase [Candidatus Competibacteraceae bacterium]|nr:RNA-directed DNA polymerase [Candidatus Competibacteraceae bacterium]
MILRLLGKGVHVAVSRYQHWAQRYPYVLKLDIQRYFPSIDHTCLKEKAPARIADPGILDLMDQVIDCSPLEVAGESAYPVTSAHAAGAAAAFHRQPDQPILRQSLPGYLDHWLKEQRGVTAYLRYVDDLALLADSKTELHDHHQALADYLSRQRLRCIRAKRRLAGRVMA